MLSVFMITFLLTFSMQQIANAENPVEKSAAVSTYDFVLEFKNSELYDLAGFLSKKATISIGTFDKFSLEDFETLKSPTKFSFTGKLRRDLKLSDKVLLKRGCELSLYSLSRTDTRSPFEISNIDCDKSELQIGNLTLSGKFMSMNAKNGNEMVPVPPITLRSNYKYDRLDLPKGTVLDFHIWNSDLEWNNVTYSDVK